MCALGHAKRTCREVRHLAASCKQANAVILAKQGARGWLQQ